MGNKKKSVSFQNINLVCPNKVIHIHRHNLRLFKAVDRRVKKTLDHKINVKEIFFLVQKSWYKSTVKTKERKTNNHASFGSSLLQNNMEVEAAIELARHLDETGSRQVRTGFAPGVTEPTKPCSGSLGSHHSNRPFLVCTKFTPGLHWFMLSSYKV